MTSAPLPLPLPRLGVGAWIPLLLLLCGTALLPPVSGGGVDGLKCKERGKGSQPCEEKSCCFRQMDKPEAAHGCRSESRGGCPDMPKCEQDKTGANLGLTCFCTTDDCNKSEDKNDPVYGGKGSGASTTGPSTTRPSGSNAAVLSVLVIVVSALGSLPALLTALG